MPRPNADCLPRAMISATAEAVKSAVPAAVYAVDAPPAPRLGWSTR
jgi:hypothetical protein